jgi:hypothetical protein
MENYVKICAATMYFHAIVLKCSNTSWYSRTVHRDISYNKSQRDALFLRMTSLADSHITSMTNTSCCEYSLKSPDYLLTYLLHGAESFLRS